METISILYSDQGFPIVCFPCGYFQKDVRLKNLMWKMPYKYKMRNEAQVIRWSVWYKLLSEFCLKLQVQSCNDDYSNESNEWSHLSDCEWIENFKINLRNAFWWPPDWSSSATEFSQIIILFVIYYSMIFFRWNCVHFAWYFFMVDSCFRNFESTKNVSIFPRHL